MNLVRKFTQILVAEEAERFAAAINDVDALTAYVSSCKVCSFRSEAERRRSDLIDELKQSNLIKKETEQASSAFGQTFFRLTVCNKDSLDVYVALVAVRSPSLKIWTAHGWWKVAAGQCSLIGSFVKGKIYLTAYNKHANWGNCSPPGGHRALGITAAAILTDL